MMEDQLTTLSLDGASIGNTLESYPSTLYSQDSTQEGQMIPRHFQIGSPSSVINVVKGEIKAEDREGHIIDNWRTQEGDKTSRYHPIEDIITVKVEVKEEGEETGVEGGEGCKEEDTSPEICTDGQCRSRINIQENAIIALDGKTEDDITANAPGVNSIVSNLYLDLHCVDPSSDHSTQEGHSLGCSRSATDHTADVSEFAQCEDRNCLSKKPKKQEAEMPYSCSDCGKCFFHKSSLWRHQKQHSGDAADTGFKPHSCSECGKCFAKKTYLTTHKKVHTGEKPHFCSECGKCFARRSHLHIHERTHTGERPYFCSECGKSFSQKAPLLIHERLHTGEKPFCCSECGKCFSRKSYLAKHESVHTGDKPFSCSECGRCFSNKSNLFTHEKAHKGEKPYFCSECGKCFTRKSHLLTHERVHRGERPYSCPECGKCFSDRSHLIAHEKIHTGQKPFSCSECGKGFTRKSYVKTHEKVHREEEPH